MKQKLLKTMLLLSALVVGNSNVWGQTTGNITFDFEESSAHRTSGTNSYTGSNSYTENSVTISLTYADAVTSGSPINGSANVMGRVAKKTTNSPVIVIGPINIENKTVTSIAFKTNGNTDITEAFLTKVDDSDYSSQLSFTCPSSTTTKTVNSLSITGTNLYLKWTGSVSEADKDNNRDFRLDDIVINYTTSGGGPSIDTDILLGDDSGATPYGTPIDVEYAITDGYTGTMTASVEPSAIADVAIGVDAITFTPKAVGTAVITISAPADGSYNAADDVEYTLTVTAPAGGGSAAPTAKFTKVTSTAGVTDGKYLIVYETGNVAFNGGLTTLDASSNTIGVSINKTPNPYEIEANATTCAATFTWNGPAGTLRSASGFYIGRTATSNGMNTNASTAYTNTISISSGDAIITGSGGPKLMYNKTSGQERFRYFKNGDQENIQLYKYQGAGFVKLNDEGYATYCSEYPLDFSGASGYTAWQITGVSGSTITFSKITGTIKGGQGILLMGDANATIIFSSANSDIELSGNKLFGTTAPTYVAAGQYYGLSGDTFVPVAASIVPAGKALLPVGAVSVKAFNFVFEDDADGIQTLSDSPLKGENIYNLAGQRLQKMQKGINIVNGKKVLF